MTQKVVIMVKPRSLSALGASRPEALAGFLLVASMLAVPLSGANAYVFTINDTGTTGGSLNQEVFSVTIQSDGTTGSTGSGAPTSFTETWSGQTSAGPPQPLSMRVLRLRWRNLPHRN